MGSPNRDENFVLSRIRERARVNIGGDIACFDGLEINESLFRIDPADVHLASIRTEYGIVSPVPAGCRGSLRSAPVRLLGRRTRDDSQTGNLFRPWFGFGRYGSLVSFGCGGQ